MKKILFGLLGVAALMLLNVASAEFYTVNPNPPVYNTGIHLGIDYNTTWPGYPVEYVTIVCPGGNIYVELDVGETRYWIDNYTSSPYISDPYVSNFGTWGNIDLSCPGGTYEVTVYGGSLNGWVY